MDSCLNTGPFNNNTHNTILLDDTIDRCGPSITLDWTSYNDWLDGVDKYNLLLELNGQPESQIAQVSNTTLNYECYEMFCKIDPSYIRCDASSGHGGSTASCQRQVQHIPASTHMKIL